jgi:phospholipid-transporting ATPase
MTSRIVKYLQGGRIKAQIDRSKDRVIASKNKQFIKNVPLGDVYNPDSNDDLGCVDYIFIDKTGTLTNPNISVSKVFVGTYTYKEYVPFLAEEVVEGEDMRNFKFVEMLKDRGNEGFKCREFMRSMAVVNNVEFEQDDQAAYTATSPDELAFVKYSAIYGAQLSNSQDKFNTRTVEEKFFPIGENEESESENNEDENDISATEYSIIFQFDFNHEARRMSMLVAYKDENDEDKISLYTKGALDVMKPRFDLAASPDFEDILIKMEDQLDRGGRAMFFARRDFKLKDLHDIFLNYFPDLKKEWNELKKKKKNKGKGKGKGKFANLKNSADLGNDDDFDEEKAQENLFQKMFVDFPHDRMDELREDLENDLTFLGSTFCQEQLEPQVMHTLKFIQMADIKTWIISGDNLESTLGICNKLNLIGRKAAIRIIFKLDDADEISEQFFVELDNKISKIKKGKSFCLAISGEYFAKIQGYEETNKLLFKQFVDILLRCELSIWGEMVPHQKKNVVRIIKNHQPDKIVLAVGDGINDIPMLIEAHVGVGIFRANQYNLCKFSDYYVQKFKDIKMLIFFFGRECYRRNCKLLLYMFFKNLLFVLSTFWAGALNFFSGMILKPTLVTNSFALILTAFPMILYGVYDKIYTKEEMLFSPLFYKTGKKRMYLNGKIFLHEIIMGIIFSCYMTYNCLLMFDWGNYKDGVFYGWFTFGNMISMGVIITVNLRILVLSNAFSLWNLIVTLISIGSYFGIWFFESSLSSSQYYNTFWEITASFQFYIFLVYVFVITIIEYIIVKIEFYEIDKKFVPDFDVKFDAVTNNAGGNVNIEYSGVSNKDIEINRQNNSRDEFYEESESEFADSDSDSQSRIR